MNIILFGFKGSGKTHFGKRLSFALHRPFIDTDNLIIERYLEQSGQQLSVREIHQVLGEKTFRALESAAIHSLTSITDSVIALGGGTVLNSDHVDFLRKIGQMVYLEAGFDTIQKRIFDQGIPAFVNADDPVGSLRKIYQERKSIYESIGARRINTDLLDEDGVIAVLRSIIILEEPPNGC
jgi:shikimate kinase